MFTEEAGLLPSFIPVGIENEMRVASYCIAMGREVDCVDNGAVVEVDFVRRAGTVDEWNLVDSSAVGIKMEGCVYVSGAVDWQGNLGAVEALTLFGAGLVG